MNSQDLEKINEQMSIFGDENEEEDDADVSQLINMSLDMSRLNESIDTIREDNNDDGTFKDLGTMDKLGRMSKNTSDSEDNDDDTKSVDSNQSIVRNFKN